MDRDRAKPVCHKRREAHLRTAGQAGAGFYGNLYGRDPSLQNPNRVVVPDLRDHDKPSQDPARYDAEVAHPDLVACQSTVEPPVGQIEELERQTFGSLDPFCEDQLLVPFVPASLDEPRHVSGIVLSVAIPDELPFGSRASGRSRGPTLRRVA